MFRFTPAKRCAFASDGGDLSRRAGADSVRYLLFRGGTRMGEIVAVCPRDVVNQEILPVGTNMGDCGVSDEDLTVISASHQSNRLWLVNTSNGIGAIGARHALRTGMYLYLPLACPAATAASLVSAGSLEDDYMLAPSMCAGRNPSGAEEEATYCLLLDVAARLRDIGMLCANEFCGTVSVSRLCHGMEMLAQLAECDLLALGGFSAGSLSAPPNGVFEMLILLWLCLIRTYEQGGGGYSFGSEDQKSDTPFVCRLRCTFAVPNMSSPEELDLWQNSVLFRPECQSLIQLAEDGGFALDPSWGVPYSPRSKPSLKLCDLAFTLAYLYDPYRELDGDLKAPPDIKS